MTVFPAGHHVLPETDRLSLSALSYPGFRSAAVSIRASGGNMFRVGTAAGPVSDMAALRPEGRVEINATAALMEIA